MQLSFCWDSANIKYVASPFADTEWYYRYRSLPASLGLVFPSQEFRRVSSPFSIRVLSIRGSPEGISIILVHLSGHWLKTSYISGTVLVPSRCPFSTQTLSGSSHPIIRCSSYCYLLHTPIINACSLLTTASLSSFKVFFFFLSIPRIGHPCLK